VFDDADSKIGLMPIRRIGLMTTLRIGLTPIRKLGLTPIRRIGFGFNGKPPQISVILGKRRDLS
jgi:hypothetical protein